MNYKYEDFTVCSYQTMSHEEARLGGSLHYYGRVNNFVPTEKTIGFTADVVDFDGKSFPVALLFGKDGAVTAQSCSCKAFAKYKSGCGHISAGYLKLKEMMEQQEKERRRILRAAVGLMNHFVEIGPTQLVKSKDVRLIPRIVIDTTAKPVKVFLELLIGREKLFVVPNLEEFITDFRAGNMRQFGSSFSFDSRRDGFDAYGDRLFHYVATLLDDRVQARTVLNLYERDKYMSGKKAMFSPTGFERFFPFLEESPFTVTLDSRKTDGVTTIRDIIPVSYELRSTPEGIQLQSVQANSPIHLFPNSPFFFFDHHIHLVPEAYGKALVPMLDACSTSKAGLLIPTEHVPTFVSVVLPKLKSLLTIHSDISIHFDYIQEELEARIEFDRTNHGISAHLDFRYGPHVIDPFLEDFKVAVQFDGKTLIRDMQKEWEIHEVFSRANFSKEDSLLHLSDDDAIHRFIQHDLPVLRELADCYYSEDFRKVRIHVPKIASAVRLSEETDMLEITFSLEDIDPAEIGPIFASLKLKKKYYKLKDGSFLPLDGADLNDLLHLLESLDVTDRDYAKKMIQIPKFRALYLDNRLREDGSHHMERSTLFKRLVQDIREPEDMDFEVPATLTGTLRDYQKTGFKWLKTLAYHGMGGILADDMGLGKTVQVLAFLLSEAGYRKHPALIIVPKSLLFNWQDEILKFAPSLTYRIVSGTPSERQALLEETKGLDILVTSYSLLRSDIESYQDLKFSWCFLDEAQHIKNPETINAKSVKLVKARGYFALTGTPIENSLTELWSIFDFLMPGYLLSHAKFSRRFETPIVKNRDAKALADLSRHSAPFILRRLKRDVAKELPEKVESKMTAEMTLEQKKVYLAYHQQAKNEISHEIAENGFAKSQIKILAILTRLRQICCHPALFLDNYEGESGKMSLLFELLEDAISGGHRVLLFSQFTGVLSIIRKQLDAQKTEYFYLDGSTSAEARMALVKTFNSGTTPLFLISLKAGGTGLNLTGADMVIHFDPWWNPAVEDQATDRAYRIGQQKMVQVFKLVTQGTIEERIFELQQKKKELIDSVIQPGETFLSKMSPADLKGLFELE